MDRYRCPVGQPLRRMGRTRMGTPLGGIQYRADPRACRVCPLKTDSCGTAAARTVTRPGDAGLSERVRGHLAMPQAKRGLRRRGCWSEAANAELKERHGLRRAQYRGRAKAHMQAYGAAIAYNVKKLVAGIRSRPVGSLRALHFGPCYCIGAACASARERDLSTAHEFDNRHRTSAYTFRRSEKSSRISRSDSVAAGPASHVGVSVERGFVHRAPRCCRRRPQIPGPS